MTSDLLRGREALLPGEEDDIRRASRIRTKDSIRQRLDDMNEQFTAIQHMSNNMEHDFKNTKLVRIPLATIQLGGNQVTGDTFDDSIAVGNDRYGSCKMLVGRETGML